MSEKWLVVRQAALDGVGVNRGSVIEVNDGMVLINGTEYKGTIKYDHMKMANRRYESNPISVPYDKELAEKIAGDIQAASAAKKIVRATEKMKVIHCDEDLMEPVDCKDTQIGKNKQAAVDRARVGKKAEGHKLEIIRGDESVEERIAELNKKNDIASLAERARLKETNKAKMPIVHDDSLGMAVGEKTVSRNAGQQFGPKEGAARVASAESSKRKPGPKPGSKRTEGAAKPGPKPKATPAADKDAEIAALKARLAALESGKGE